MNSPKVELGPNSGDLKSIGLWFLIILIIVIAGIGWAWLKPDKLTQREQAALEYIEQLELANKELKTQLKSVTK